MFNRSPVQESAAPERKKVGMLIPPPILLVVLVLLCAVAHLAWFGAFNFSIIRTVVAIVFIVGSVLLVASCGRLFQRAGTPVRPTSPTTTVVSGGAYRFSRNPMYVGMTGLLLGFGLLLGSYIFLAGALLFVAIVNFGVVLPEERYLESTHGAAYAQYKQSVRRWV